VEDNEKKSLIGSILKVLIPIIIIAAIVVAIISIKPEEEIVKEIEVRSFDSEEDKYVLENDKLKFTLDSATTQFELQVKDTGVVWTSNPKDAAKDDKALAADKNILQSTLLLTYGNINGVWTQYNNFALSVEKGIYQIEASDDEIRVLYTIGNTEAKYLIPLAVPEDRFNEWIDKMDKKPKKQVLEYYRKLDIKKLKSTDDKDELLKKYPDLEEHCIYVLRDNVKTYLKAKIETLFAEVGYNEEEYEADLALYEQSSSQDIPLFNITMVYKLDGEDLIVSIPYEEIDFKPDYPLTNIEVLPFFGAGSTEDEGFIVVPESGGCIINFNNERFNQNAYYSNVYGWDYCTTRTAVVSETRSSFPMYGISNNGSAFICCIEDGASFANINADVSGRKNSYNHADAAYSVLHYEAFDVADRSTASFYVFENEVPKINVSQRYRFVNTDSYVKMAEAYGEYLNERYPKLNKTVSSADTPVVVDVLQCVDKVQQKFGVPSQSPYALTTYDETVKIADELQNIGIKNFDMKISGWMNEGYTHSVLKDIDLISDLGGKSDFKNMLSSLSSKGVNVFLDAQTEFAYNSGLTDGFVAFRDAARFTTRENAELYDYSIIWYGQDKTRSSYYLLRPTFIREGFDNLIKFAKDYNANISLRNTGHLLNSDFNPKELYTREMIIAQQREDLEKTVNGGTKVIINNGNDYAVEYADIITNMDISDTNTAIIDYDIPFYQIALHGKVNYTGDPINMAENFDFEILKSAEYGAGLSFQVMGCSSSRLQDTYYTNFYGADFDLWKDRIATIYSEYSKAFDGLFDKKITNHYLASDKVRVTEYENGAKVYVNYSYDDETVDGITLAARSYLVK